MRFNQCFLGKNPSVITRISQGIHGRIQSPVPIAANQCNIFILFCAADVDISVKNHLIGFAAEEARRNGTVVDIDRFFEGYGISNK